MTRMKTFDDQRRERQLQFESVLGKGKVTTTAVMADSVNMQSDPQNRDKGHHR